MTTRRSSVARSLVAVTTIVALLAPLAMGAFGQPAPDDFEPRQFWKTVQAPNWRTGADRISQYAWDPYNVNVLYATNGTEIQRSGNQGDSWERAYVLPSLTDAAGFTADDSEIIDLRVDEGTAATDVYALVQQTTPAGATRPHVIASHDGGRVWAPSDVGLPPTGRPIALRVAPNDPNEVYLALALGDNTVDLIYKSTNSGGTWLLQSNLSESGGRAQNVITGFEVDPQDSDELWASSGNGLFHSGNAGASFASIDRFTRETGPIDVYNGPGDAQISVFFPGLDRWQRRIPIGWTEFHLRGAEGGVSSVAHGSTDKVLFITAGGNAFAWNDQTESWVDLDPPATGLTGMLASRGLSQAFSAHNTQTIQIYTGPVTDLITKLPRYLIDVPQILDGDEPVQFPPKLGPKRRKVVLDPGEKKTVGYTLRLPPRPLPLDVYFLLDTSASTTTFLANVARSVADIANGLRQRGITVRFGLADYRAYPSRTPPRRACGPGERASMNDCEANYIYKKRVELSYDNGDELETALETLLPDGGGEYRSMYAALYHSVSGAPQDVGPPGFDDMDVPPGQQADFAKSVKVILHAVDESFPTNETVDDGGPGDLIGVTSPDMTSDSEAIAALQAQGVYQVGLSTGSESLADLRKVAAATNALAPAGGVDCKGDGTIDIPAGEPLVCSVNPNVSTTVSGLPDAIERLLYATAPTTDVAFKVSGAPVVEKFGPDRYTDVLQSTNRLDFAVTFGCPRLGAAREYDVDLGVALEKLSDPTASTTVVCRVPDPADPPEEVLPPLPPVPPAAAALVALVLPPPPPPPPPILEISSASQSQSQAQAQAGMAHQEQEQPQLAWATASRDVPDEELAFSAYREESESLVTPVRALGAGAVLMSFAFGFVMLSQELAREKVLNRRR